MNCKHNTPKKQELVRLILCMLMGLFWLAVMALFSSAWADAGYGGTILRHKTWAKVGCGDTIDSDQTVTLKNNIRDCNPTDKNAEAALTVIGPATLNLNGHTVSCSGDQEYNGILVKGSRVRIFNGTVTNCDRGILLNDNENDAGGWHEVEKVTADSNNRGIVVGEFSNNNYLANNIAVNNTRGIRVEGDRNTLYGNTASKNTRENYQIKGDNNCLVNNIAYRGQQECFLIEGDNNILVNNSAKKCEAGFVLSGEEQVVNNRIINCEASHNEIDGIVAGEGATGNDIIHNKARHNEYDLHDDNNGCDDNVWQWNEFLTKEPEDADCIK